MFLYDETSIIKVKAIFLGEVSLDECNLVPVLHTTTLLLNNDLEKELYEYIKHNVNSKNIATYYKLAKVYFLPHLAKSTSRHIERFFTSVAKTKNFLELNFSFVKNIFSSSYLNVDTEIEVFNAEDAWVNYKSEERKKFSFDLWSKIRTDLLSSHAVEHIFHKTSVFDKDEKYKLLKEIRQNKKNFYQNKCSGSCTSRYCDQDEFDIITIGNLFFTQNVNLIDKRKNVTRLGDLHEKREDIFMVCLKNDVYIFGGSEEGMSSIMVKKYSPLDDRWLELPDLDSANRNYFSLCAFMESIYLIGGWVESSDEFLSNCIEYDARSCEWKEVAKMHEPRANPASVVFEGNVVASGGKVDIVNQSNRVELFDHVANEWSFMANMVKSRHSHRLVALRNKLFVLGGPLTNSMEVYDSACCVFTLLKMPSSVKNFFKAMHNCVLIERKILILLNKSSNMVVYDTDTNKFSEETCTVTKKQCNQYLCTKMAYVSNN